MKILLVNPPIRLDQPPYIHPFGLGIIASVLRSAGHLVAIADMNTARGNGRQAFLRPPPWTPELVGVGGIISTFKVVRSIIPWLRQRYPGIPIVIGGGGATSAPEVYMRCMAPDILVLGEGEYTVMELVAHLETGHPALADIAGIAYTEEGELKRTPPRPLEKNLDVFPMPAFDLLDMEAYITHPKYSLTAKREAAIIASRGCPFDCSFCYHVFGRGARFRSADHVVAEIRYLVENYDIGALLWADEFWTAHRRFVTEICEKLTPLNLDWMCYSRADVINDETLALMKRAGCSLIGLGLESGSQRILDAMSKGTTVAKNIAAWRAVERCGIRVSGTLIYGYPGEDEETILETIQFCKEIRQHGASFFLAPYPGTRVFDQHRQQIEEKFGSLEEFFSRLGDAGNFVVNLTGWPDDWLIARAAAARLEIKAHNLMCESREKNTFRR